MSVETDELEEAFEGQLRVLLTAATRGLVGPGQPGGHRSDVRDGPGVGAA